MKTPAPDFTKENVSAEDVNEWVRQGFTVELNTFKFTNAGAYWTGEKIVVYEMGQVKGQ